MKLETLKNVCDKVIGFEGQLLHGTDSDGDEVVLRYRTESGAFLLDVPIGEHAATGWHLQGKIDFHAESLYDSLHRAFRTERMKEVSDIQRSRGFVKSEGEKKFLIERIKRLEGALRVAQNWMGKRSDDNEDKSPLREHNALQRDAAFVEHTLASSPEYTLDTEE